MKLYLVHCGFYDAEICAGIYESHINIFVTGESLDEAKKKARLNPNFQLKKMHIDGIQEIDAIDGFQISLTPTDLRETQVVSHLHRDL